MLGQLKMFMLASTQGCLTGGETSTQGRSCGNCGGNLLQFKTTELKQQSDRLPLKL